MATTARFLRPDGAGFDIFVTKPRRGVASAVGLIGRSEIAPDHAMLLRGRQVHTFGMTFAIDVVYLDADFKVVKVQTLRSGRLGPIVWRARWILEMKQGESNLRGVAEGWRLEMMQE